MWFWGKNCRTMAGMITLYMMLARPVLASPAQSVQKNGSVDSEKATGKIQNNRAHNRRPSKTRDVATDTDIQHMVREIDPARIETTVRTLVDFGTRNTLSVQDDPKRGIGAARDWIAGQFRKIAAAPECEGRLSVTLQSFTQPVAPRVPRPTVLTNVVAMLRGVQAEAQERYVIVSGHYDSMCTSPTNAIDDAPGANDDASGVAAILELTRVMSRYRFNATLIFMAVPGEEQGLLGATYYATEARKSNVHIESMFTNDIIGNSTGQQGSHDDRSVRIFSEGVPSDESETDARLRRSIGGENDGPSRQLARLIKEAGERFVPGFHVNLIYRRDRYLRGGDHIPFLENGYPAVRVTEPNENYLHQHQNVRVENGIQYGDLPEFVDYPYLAQVARINCAALATLALAPDVPERAMLLTRQLTNDTTLQWAPGNDPNIAGYEVVWRDTSAPLWTHVRKLGKVNSYTFPGLSKDNVLFGVRAVDIAGHRSPVAYPHPGRGQ